MMRPDQLEDFLSKLWRALSGIELVNWQLWFHPDPTRSSETEATAPTTRGRWSRARGVLVFLVLLAVTVVGSMTGSDATSFNRQLIWVVAAGGVALLFISDRGQHRRLADNNAGLERWWAVLLTVDASFLNNLMFCALAVGLGWMIEKLFAL